MRFIQSAKRFLGALAASLVIASTSCSAKAELQQVPLPALCGAFNAVVQELSRFQQVPILVGESEGKHIVYWLNPRTGNFSVTISNQEIMCLLAMGINAKPYVEKQQGEPVVNPKQI